MRGPATCALHRDIFRHVAERGEVRSIEPDRPTQRVGVGQRSAVDGHRRFARDVGRGVRIVRRIGARSKSRSTTSPVTDWFGWPRSATSAPDTWPAADRTFIVDRQLARRPAQLDLERRLPAGCPHGGNERRDLGERQLVPKRPPYRRGGRASAGCCRPPRCANRLGAQRSALRSDIFDVVDRITEPDSAVQADRRLGGRETTAARCRCSWWPFRIRECHLRVEVVEPVRQPSARRRATAPGSRPNRQ